MGQALKKALGDFGGLVRFGHAYTPLDEALSRAVVDVSNRPHIEWRVGFERDKVGDMETELSVSYTHLEVYKRPHKTTL